MNATRHARSWVLAFLLVGCGDSPPEVDQTDQAILSSGTHYDGFQITNYTVALESNYGGAIVNNPPSLSGAYHQDFLCSGTGVAMQGTGLDNESRYVHYSGGGGGWCNGYNYLCDCSTATFNYVSGPPGSCGSTVQVNHSIATDHSVIPCGWSVWIDQLGAWYTADDSGGAINGAHLDVFTGGSNPGYNMTSGVYVSSTPHNYGDASPYGGGGGGSPPAQPSSLYPGGNVTLGGSEVTLSWGGVAGATNYNVYMYYLSGGAWTYYYEWNVSGSSMPLYPQFNNTEYLWYVQACNGAGCSPWSSAEFDWSNGPVCGNYVCEAGESCSTCPTDCGACVTIPSQPYGLSPDNWSYVGSPAYLLWYTGSGAATTFYVLIYYWSGGQWTYYYEYQTSSSVLSFYPQFTNSYYTWSVVGCNSAGCGPWSSWATFTH